MRVLRAESYRRMLWKNGGGTTREITLAPEGADFASFRWRVSIADIAVDGPFSPMPGIDRSCAVIRGNGVRLSIGARAPKTFDCQSAPVSFSGDDLVHASLIDGPIIDLNVMTRRDQCRHVLHLTTLQEARTINLQSKGPGVAILVALSEGLVVSHVGELAWNDAVVASNGESLVATSTSQVKLAWIEIFTAVGSQSVCTKERAKPEAV